MIISWLFKCVRKCPGSVVEYVALIFCILSSTMQEIILSVTPCFKGKVRQSAGGVGAGDVYL